MVQIFSSTEDTSMEYLNLKIDNADFDFIQAKNITKEKALERCDFPMILSWSNKKACQTYPDYECGTNQRPFWIRYAEGRGANLVVDFNDGEYTFMVLKI